MKTIVVIVLALTLNACASVKLTPLDKKRENIKQCTLELLGYEATVKEASDACINIYRSSTRKK